MLVLSALCRRDPLSHIDSRTWDRIVNGVRHEWQICPRIHLPWDSCTGSCRRVRSPCTPGWLAILPTHRQSKAWTWWQETSLRIRSPLGKPNTQNTDWAWAKSKIFTNTSALMHVGLQWYLLNKKKHVITLSHQMPPKGSCKVKVEESALGKIKSTWRIMKYRMRWVRPLPSNSHQDYYLSSRGSQPKPLFTTVTAEWVTPNVCLQSPSSSNMESWNDTPMRLVVLMSRFIFPAASFCNLTTWKGLDWTGRTNKTLGISVVLEGSWKSWRRIKRWRGKKEKPSKSNFKKTHKPRLLWKVVLVLRARASKIYLLYTVYRKPMKPAPLTQQEL